MALVAFLPGSTKFQHAAMGVTVICGALAGAVIGGLLPSFAFINKKWNRRENILEKKVLAVAGVIFTIGSAAG